MTYIDFIKTWVSLLNEHQKDIDKTTDELLEAHFQEYGRTNKFDTIKVIELIKLAYCIGFKNALNKE